jgi:hypothetical protein
MPKSKPPRKKKESTGKGGRSENSPPLTDPRAMEGVMAGLLPLGDRDDLLREAQEVMYDAWDAATRGERVKLAHKALRITATCADAYVLLAEESAKTLDEALELYRRGTEAGELERDAFRLAHSLRS